MLPDSRSPKFRLNGAFSMSNWRAVRPLAILKAAMFATGEGIAIEA